MHMDTEPQSPPQLETILQSPPIQPSYQIDEQALADTLLQYYDITFSQASLKMMIEPILRSIQHESQVFSIQVLAGMETGRNP